MVPWGMEPSESSVSAMNIISAIPALSSAPRRVEPSVCHKGFADIAFELREVGTPQCNAVPQLRAPP